MRLWLRVRGAGVLVVVLALLAVLLRLAGSGRLVLPTVVGGGTTSLVWATFLPLGWGAAVAHAFAGTVAPVEARPGRRVLHLDAALLLTSTLAVTAVWAALGSGAGPPLGAVAHVVLLGSLACACTVVGGSGGGVAVGTGALLVTASYNARLPGAARVRVLEPDGSVRWSLAVAAALLAVALATLLGRRSVQAHQRR